jgi:hypothetical protein
MRTKHYCFVGLLILSTYGCGSIENVNASGDTLRVSGSQNLDSSNGSAEWPPCEEGGEPGCPCQENSQCDSGYCAATDTGKVCAGTCVKECPEGWECVPGNNPACVKVTNGEPGANGAQGDTGEKGAPGDNGIQGGPGENGEKGAPGDKGIQGGPGAKGIQGDTGPAGPKGDTGGQGLKGVPGPAGAKGAPGAKGDKGDSCSVKANGDGSKTITCEDGTTVTITDGAKGEPGPKGDKGDTGPPGPPAAELNVPAMAPVLGMDTSTVNWPDGIVCGQQQPDGTTNTEAYVWKLNFFGKNKVQYRVSDHDTGYISFDATSGAPLKGSAYAVTCNGKNMNQIIKEKKAVYFGG